MEIFFKDLGDKIQQAIKKDIQSILQEIDEERIYSVALVTDSDCITLYLAINTYEYMQKEDEKYIKMNQSSFSEEIIKKMQEGTINLSKWIPAEWGYSDGKNSELTQISKLLYEKEKSLNVEEYPRYMELFFETITHAFKHLIESKTFGEKIDEITFFISMSDDERTPEIENYSAKLLNSKNLYEEFLKRNEYWENLYSDN
ncbi:MAG: DUF4303 domain-containing protein [Lachnospiraceae bacterium]|nr:DUF4303 domain-containing protein [Lachnospiraceae bacterium]